MSPSSPRHAPGGASRSFLRLGAIVFGIAALTIAAGLAALSFFEDSFIYHPDRGLDRDPSDLGLAFEPVTLATADGERIGGWMVPAEEPVATVLFLHGNAGNRAGRIELLAALRRAGFTTLMIDYRGYGDSTGSPSERGLLVDATAAWDYLTRERGIPPGRIVLYGESLGSNPTLALAARLASDHRPGPGAIVLEGAFTSALGMGHRMFPFLPLSWMLRTRLDNLAAIRRVTTPTLFLHGEADTIVPIDMGRALHGASAARLKQFVAVPGAGHNSLWWSGTKGRLGETIRGFVEEAFVLPRR